ncbi:MAG: hypothetical protein AUG89_03505 [Acidobacteria bacterium 13_1_20CM_4_56_7]|nr:MAG: hypothetical protein AUG89_03505 [Acidobacteria bacterium 13_1_20CM_4_56_7]
MSELEPTNEVTRRQWILILGRLGVIAGFSGVVPEFASVLSAAGGVGNKALPPGLYYPSEDHLSHALSDVGSHQIPRGSETEYVQPSSDRFRPQFFSEKEFELVTKIIQVLLGEVDAGVLSQVVNWLDLRFHSAAGIREAALKLDPLRRALAVAYYGESPVRELEIADPQSVMRSGLATLEQLSFEQYDRGFLELDGAQQTRLVAISTAKPDGPLRELFGILRAEAVRGYYTSAEGLKDLDYKGNWYYAASPGCERK